MWAGEEWGLLLWSDMQTELAAGMTAGVGGGCSESGCCSEAASRLQWWESTLSCFRFSAPDSMLARRRGEMEGRLKGGRRKRDRSRAGRSCCQTPQVPKKQALAWEGVEAVACLSFRTRVVDVNLQSEFLTSESSETLARCGCCGPAAKGDSQSSHHLSLCSQSRFNRQGEGSRTARTWRGSRMGEREKLPSRLVGQKLGTAGERKAESVLWCVREDGGSGNPKPRRSAVCGPWPAVCCNLRCTGAVRGRA